MRSTTTRWILSPLAVMMLPALTTLQAFRGFQVGGTPGGLAVGARVLTVAAPVPIAELDLGKMKGGLTRLAWSSDGADFYVQTIERDRTGHVKATRHYIVSNSSMSVKDIAEEPAWAAKYWEWKSAQSSPASQLKITVEGPRRETKRTTAAPTGGVLARGGSTDPSAGTTVSDVAAAVDQSQVQMIYTLKLGNETLGEWINEPVIPGVNFSWAPAPLAFLAFTKRDGGPIMVLDEAGNKQQLAGAKSAFFPAWSGDGKRLAWLERRDKKRYILTAADVSLLQP